MFYIILFYVKSLPHADFMRYLTSKLGQFLGLEKIEIVPIKEIASRFLVDLNLPSKPINKKT